ncbi:H-NS family nucleoid-associated regulatory protein [Bradyrhizobium genosp. P]|uniref:H-NS histone family protein n=1 Tax=Bradyrhizobium genosp. P TaxID=83641 RepID=UPI003CEE5354
MSLDELWTVHEALVAALTSRIEAERRTLEQRLAILIGKSQKADRRRPYPKVLPKFRNPNKATETWSGRGKQPRWLVRLLSSGTSLDDCRIDQN